MINNPTQFLAYFAGRTKRIDMGTMVVVLPWHDPIMVAEGYIALDVEPVDVSSFYKKTSKGPTGIDIPLGMGFTAPSLTQRTPRSSR